MANQIDSGTNGVRCAALIPNTDGVLLPRMSARVHLDTRVPPRSVLVPSIALMYPDGVYAAGQKRSLSVVVVTDRNARELRSAEVGLFYDDARVVTEGVKAGVWIVIDRKSLRNASGREATIDLERVPWPTSGFSAEAKGSTR